MYKINMHSDSTNVPTGDFMKMKKETGLCHKLWFKVMLYIISVALIVFYLVVMWWGIHPKVGTEYRMYYLTHELSDWPGYGNLTYEFGTKEICTKLKDRNGKNVPYKVCQRKGQGWQKEPYEGSVNIGGTSSIYYIPNEQASKAEYKIDINAFTGDGKVSVYANDKFIGEFNQQGQYTFAIEMINKDELLQIKFVADNCEFRLWSTQIN
jgi:hypothetical protein